MTTMNRVSIAALVAACLAPLLLTAGTSGAFAQAKQAPAAQAAPTRPEPPKQIDLTARQLDGVLASQKDLNAILDKLTPGATDKPDPKVTAELDAVVKKNGFASYDEYNDVVDTISLVLGGFDPQTKTYVGPEAVIKGQISAVEADKKMPAADKKEALSELNQALKMPPPPIQNKANIDLVGKYYDRLAAAMQDE